MCAKRNFMLPSGGLREVLQNGWNIWIFRNIISSSFKNSKRRSATSFSAAMSVAVTGVACCWGFICALWIGQTDLNAFKVDLWDLFKLINLNLRTISSQVILNYRITGGFKSERTSGVLWAGASCTKQGQLLSGYFKKVKMTENNTYQILNISVTSLRAHIAFKREARTQSNEFLYNSMPRSCFLEQFAAELYVFHPVWIQCQGLSAVQQHSMAESRHGASFELNSSMALVLISFMRFLPSLRKPKASQKDTFVLEC